MALRWPVKDAAAIAGLERNLQSFWAAWTGAKDQAGGKIPKRNAITVGALRSLAFNCFVVERMPGGEYFFRMIGSGVERLFDRSLTDQPIAKVLSDEAKPRVETFFNTILDTPVGGYTADIVTTKTGHKIRIVAMNLPVTDEEGVLNRIISFSDMRGVGFDLDTVAPEETRATYQELEDAFFIDLGVPRGDCS